MNQRMTSEGFEKMVGGQYADSAEALLKAYPHATDEEALQAARDLMRDSMFGWPTRAWATLHSRNGKSKGFVYYFDHRIPGVPAGADHGAEIVYVFGNLNSRGPAGGGAPTPDDNVMHELVSSYCANFAKNGDPNGKGLPDWPAFDEKEQQVMYFNGESGAMQHPNLEKIMAFDAYYAKLREKMKIK
jgi:para-nitrobenzyl esterase